MAKIVLFEEQTLSFSYDEEMGLWFSNVFESVPNFTVGETYKVVWDGVTYNCVAQDVDAIMPGFLAVGNLTAWGLEGNNEPFIIGSNPSMSVATIISLYDTSASTHTVGIYQGEDVGVLLTNNKGEDVAYFGAENILIRTTEDGATQSGQQNFTKGEAIEGLEIELSLGNGDQILQASEGYLVKSAVIKKPDTLVPENIVKDVEIAGVKGTYSGGGGGSQTERDTFPFQTLSGFVEDTSIPNSAYVHIYETFEIKKGETYYVDWDGTTYTCKGIIASYEGSSIPYIGNGSALGFQGNNEPFAIINFAEQFMAFSAFNDLSESHDVRVYQKIGTIECTLDDAGNITEVKCIELKELPIDFFYKSSSGSSTIKTLDLSECPDLTVIPKQCFRGVTSLTKVILPKSINTIQSYAFVDCPLTSVVYTGTLSDWLSITRENYIGKLNTYYTLYLDGEEIKDWSNVEIPSDITEIKNYAFSNSYFSNTITIPDSVTKIGNNAFWQSSLKSIVIPDFVSELGNSVFHSCKSLTSITFGSGITETGSNVLSYCTALQSVTFKEGISTISDSFIQYGSIPLPSITIPASVKKIGKGAFSGLSSSFKSAIFEDPYGWYVSLSSTATSGTNLTLTNASNAATYLRSTYDDQYWFNND